MLPLKRLFAPSLNIYALPWYVFQLRFLSRLIAITLLLYGLRLNWTRCIGNAIILQMKLCTKWLTVIVLQ